MNEIIKNWKTFLESKSITNDIITLKMDYRNIDSTDPIVLFQEFCQTWQNEDYKIISWAEECITWFALNVNIDKTIDAIDFREELVF